MKHLTLNESIALILKRVSRILLNERNSEFYIPKFQLIKDNQENLIFLTNKTWDTNWQGFLDTIVYRLKQKNKKNKARTYNFEKYGDGIIVRRII